MKSRLAVGGFDFICEADFIQVCLDFVARYARFRFVQAKDTFPITPGRQTGAGGYCYF
jgi:hypothetical protein